MKKIFLLLIIFISGFILGTVFSFYFFSVKNRKDSLPVKINHSLTTILTPILISFTPYSFLSNFTNHV